MSDFIDLLDRRLSIALTPARRIWLHKPRTLWLGFITLHVTFLIALLPAILTGDVLGDLPLYRTWANLGLNFGYWQGIDTEWVYPIGALAPIALAGIGGPHLYQFLWFLMTAALNALAVGILTDWGRKASGYGAAWWWLLISFLLSPVGLLRLEGLTAPLVIVGLVLLAKRPIVASALLSAATWIKVWPAAVLLAVIGGSRRRVTALLTGVAVTAAVVASVWAAGGLRFIAGFVTMQSDRALQLEAPVTTPWVWMAALGERHTVIYQNYAIATREVTGPGTELVASVLTPLMFAMIAVIFVLMLLARRRVADSEPLLLVGALALVSAFVVFNKVGSPQYMLWLAPIVAVGVARGWRAWRVPAVLLIVISALTTLVFPILYLPLVDGDPLALSFLTLRNGLLVVLLGWAVARLVGLGEFRIRPVDANRPLQFAGADR